MKHKLQLAALSVGLAVCATAIPCGLRATTADAAEKKYDLGSVVTLGDGNSSRNLAASPFDAVNLTCLYKGGADTEYDQYVNFDFYLEKTDLSEAESLVIQVGNSYWGPISVNFKLSDANNQGQRVIGNNWASSDDNKAAGQFAVKFYDELGGEVKDTTYVGGGFEPIPGPSGYYMEIPMSDFSAWEPEQGNTFDAGDVRRVVVEFDTLSNEYTKINIGNMYYKTAAGTFEQIFDVTKAHEGQDANGYQKWYKDEKRTSHVVLDVLSANELKAYSYFGNTSQNEQWAGFYMLMPMNISEYNGIAYYVDNTKTGATAFFNKYLYERVGEANTEPWYCDAGFATYFPDGGESFVGDANTIPAGFKGTIVIPFTNLAYPGWGEKGNGVLNLENVWWNFGFTTDTTRGLLDLVIKDFYLTDSAREFVRSPQEATWYGDTKIVLPFDYIDDFDLGSDWATSWSDAVPATLNQETITVPATVKGAGGGAMKFTVGTKGTQPSASDSTAVEHKPAGEQTDLKGAKGITFYIKNTSSHQIGLVIGFDSTLPRIGGEGTDNQRWQTGMLARYMLYDVNTGLQVVRNSKIGIYVPKGFEGWVRMDFSQFENPDWEDRSEPFSNENPIEYFVINVSGERHPNESFLLDSIGYYYTDAEISTTFHPSSYTILDAMNSNYTHPED